MSSHISISDRAAGIGVAIVLASLAIGINHFQKLGAELTVPLPATPVRELASVHQTCGPNILVKPNGAVPATGTPGQRAQHTPKHG